MLRCAFFVLFCFNFWFYFQILFLLSLFLCFLALNLKGRTANVVAEIIAKAEQDFIIMKIGFKGRVRIALRGTRAAGERSLFHHWVERLPYYIKLGSDMI